MAAHVDHLINDTSFKRGLKEQLLNTSVATTTNTNHHKKSVSKKDEGGESVVGINSALRGGGNTTIKKQMIYQTDIQVKMGQINKKMDEEFENLD